MNDYIIETMIREQRADMLREAKRLRMVRLYEQAQGKRRDWLMRTIADLLIHTGEKIKSRCDGEMELASNM